MTQDSASTTQISQLLAQLLVDGDEHDAVVVDALQPEEHAHHTYIEDEHERRRQPVHATPARAGVVTERHRNIGLGRAGHGLLCRWSRHFRACCGLLLAGKGISAITVATADFVL